MVQRLDSLLDASLKIVRACGRIIAQNWDKPHSVSHKGPIDLVTETDFAVQAQLSDALAQLLPQAAFVGEEGASPGSPALSESEWAWVADPVDGTTNFVHRLPFVAVSLALCQRGKPKLGIVYAPILDECFYARCGGGAWLNGKRIGVSQVASLRDAVAATGFPYDIAPSLAEILARLGRVLPATQGLRRLGSAALDLAYVACGRMDVFFEAELKPWDMAAGVLLVEEAGGRTSDFAGNAAILGAPLLATNRRLHPAVLALL